MGEDLGFNFGRHTERLTDVHSGENIRAQSAGYEAISEHGVELSRIVAEDIKQQLDASPAGTILFIGGSSEEQRTKSTAEVYGDALEDYYVDNQDVIVLSKKAIDAWRESRPDVNIIGQIETVIAQNPDKKVVVAYPLFLKEFSLRPEFRTKEAPHGLTDYSLAVQPKGVSEQQAVKTFFSAEGKPAAPNGMVVEGPTARDIVRKYLQGVARLREFAHTYAPDRPIRIEFISHGLILDALTSYLANNGEPTTEGFERTGDKMVQSSERGEVELQGDNATFIFRGARYDIPKHLLQPEEV